MGPWFGSGSQSTPKVHTPLALGSQESCWNTQDSPCFVQGLETEHSLVGVPPPPPVSLPPVEPPVELPPVELPPVELPPFEPPVPPSALVPAVPPSPPLAVVLPP